MKKTVVLFFLLGIVLTGFSQVKLDYNAKPKSEAIGFSTKGLSASSAHFLCQLRQVEATTDRSLKESLYAQLQKDYSIMQGKVSAIIVLAAGQTPQDLAAYDVTVGTVSGDMLTAMIPVARFVELAESGVCATIDVGEKQNLMMDNARENLGIDQIHAGMNLPQGYDGSGVVVGIIDVGFEYCHPAFYDTTGTTLRVKRVWAHKDSTGTAPAGYNYGSEYTTLSQMMTAGTDDTSATHGSHVASTAAGCGAPSGDGANYKGIAKGADIVLVPAILDDPHIMDAIQYIYSYAQSVSKPCVINMSFGSMVGPHDGTAVEDRFLSSFVAQHPDSIVLVASAGNSGNDQVHLEKHFSTEDTLLTTRLMYDLLQNKNGMVDVWGDKNFSVALTLVSTTTNQQVDFTGFFTTGIDTSFVVNLLSNSNDTVSCRFYLSQIDSINHRYNAAVRFGTIPSYHQLILTVRCDTLATIHAWCNRVSFNETSLVDGTVSGDSHYTVSGYGTNSDAVISVGSYATRLGYTTYQGYYYSGASAQEMGDISYFSSVGPTFDGRVKPDITAPGSMIVAACNRFDPMEIVYDTIEWNGQIEQYTALQGTSMSSPMVTGIVALWMQHNPSLGTDSVRAILHGTAHNDRFTGNCLTTPNNTWGHGKVNAFGGLPTNTTMWLLNAFDMVDGSGCVEGGGVVTEGTHILTAIPASNHIFVSWEDGNTDNPRTVNVTCDTTFIAVFAPFDYEDCDTVVDFPWSATFDEELTCWKLIDADGDGELWGKLSSSVCSMVVGAGAANTDNWFISPAIEVNQNLNLKVATHSINAGGSQKCSLLLSTSGSEMSDFTTELDNYTYTAIEDKDFVVSLAEFQGQVVRIALRHHNCVGPLAYLSLKDFNIEIAQDSVLVPTYAESLGYTLTAQGLQLNITGAEGHALQIFDLTGRLVVSKPDADGYCRMPSSGVYIIRVDGFKPRKVMVMQ
jgi:subtilisin family serine protease